TSSIFSHRDRLRGNTGAVAQERPGQLTPHIEVMPGRDCYPATKSVFVPRILKTAIKKPNMKTLPVRAGGAGGRAIGCGPAPSPCEPRPAPRARKKVAAPLKGKDGGRAWRGRRESGQPPEECRSTG